MIDLTGEEMLDLGSKTLVSYRGWNGQDGTLLYTEGSRRSVIRPS